MNGRLYFVVAATTLLAGGGGPLAALELLPIAPMEMRLARGFHISRYADARLADDIRAMTLDAAGRVVVAGPGYIKTLHDLDTNGVADTFTLFAEVKAPGQFLACEGPTLFYGGDGQVFRYEDEDGDGRADGPPEIWLPLETGERGGQAMRKGPDGWWYLMAGNNTRFNARHVSSDTSPIRVPEAGALLRLTPNGQTCEVIAHGFDNPRGFDFDGQGGLFTCDRGEDSERFLPWHFPARLYHLGHAGHHGWRQAGDAHSGARPDDYFDTVAALDELDCDLPAAVVCYRHFQFPPLFRNGLFILDWAGGKMLFTPLLSHGASYQTAPEVFLEATGLNGFAPDSAVVAPDGSLLVATGGRKTEGAIYRIQYFGEDHPRAPPVFTNLLPVIPIDAVLQAPQPLEAWSRARWLPVALRLGPAPFGRVIANEAAEPAQRVRAVEVVTELFGGLAVREARVGARALPAELRARVAWSLGRQPCADFGPMLLPLAFDAHPLVRVCALEALASRFLMLDDANLAPAVSANLDHPDQRVRQAGARLAALLPEAQWREVQSGLTGPGNRLTAALAAVWRDPYSIPNTNGVDTALTVLKTTTDPHLRLDALRLLILALGDFRLEDPAAEAFSGYELAHPLEGRSGMAARIRGTVRPLFPSIDPRFDAESARLLGMLEEADAGLLRLLLGKITAASDVASDFHYLAVLARLRGPRQTEVPVRTAHALVSLERKLAGLSPGAGKSWEARLREVVGALLRRDPPLADALLRHPNFARPAHVGWTSFFNPEQRQRAASLFLHAAQKGADFTWSEDLTVLLALLPAEQVRPLFRQFWANAALRDELARRFFPQPGAPDLAKVPAPQPPHAPGGGEADWPQWSVLLRSASWARGEPVRGEAIFHERGCAGCHAGASPLGPDLRPAVSRLKTEELFQTILYPDREVQESWRPTEFRLRDGRVITGLVVYESAHFWLVQTGPAATARLPKAGVLARRPATHSFMPGGLLNGLQPQDLASLYAWLKQLP